MCPWAGQVIVGNYLGKGKRVKRSTFKLALVIVLMLAMSYKLVISVWG